MRKVLPIPLAVFLAAGVALGMLFLVASEARSAPYSQVVDDAASGRFSAPSGWSESSYSPDRYGSGYRYARPDDGEPAEFKVSLPDTARYAVYARWPANGGYNSATPIGVMTQNGYEWTRVNQQENGGRWVKLGTYGMDAGDRYRVRVSRRSDKEGYVVADAVKFVKVTDVPRTDSSDGASGSDVVRQAKTWLGVPYRYGGTSREGVDCSGLVYKVFGNLGVSMPRTAQDQYLRGTAVSAPLPGDLVFGHADGGSGVEHVGIVTGDNQMIHAPQPGTVVRYDTFENGWYNVVGYKRIVPNG